MPAKDIVALVEALDDEGKAALQQLCGILAPCFGASATKKAIIVLQENHIVSFINLNADVQESYDLLDSATSVFRERVVGAVPDRKDMN